MGEGGRGGGRERGGVGERKVGGEGRGGRESVGGGGEGTMYKMRRSRKEGD